MIIMLRKKVLLQKIERMEFELKAQLQNTETLLKKNRELMGEVMSLSKELDMKNDDIHHLTVELKKIEEKHAKYVKKVNDKTVDVRKKWLHGYPDE